MLRSNGLKIYFHLHPPASLNIPIRPLLSKIERKFQIAELLSIYGEKLLYFKFFDSYNCLEVMVIKLIFTSPPWIFDHRLKSATIKDRKKISINRITVYICWKIFVFKFFYSYKSLEVMGWNLNSPPPGSLTILLSPLLSKIDRKSQLVKSLPIYVQHLKLSDSYNCLWAKNWFPPPSTFP